MCYYDFIAIIISPKPIVTERFSAPACRLELLMPSNSEKTFAASQWENEGGAMRPSIIDAAIGQKSVVHGANPSQQPLPARSRRSSKLPADTAIGCRDRAAADLLASAAMPNGNARLRMEASAASWAARAELLQNDEEEFEAYRRLRL
jgi:hypothetical protein